MNELDEPLTVREIWAFSLVENLLRQLKERSRIQPDPEVESTGPHKSADPGNKRQVGSITIDFHRREVTAQGKVVELTPKGYAVIALLASRDGAPVSYNELSEVVWGRPYDQASRGIHQMIVAIRKALESDPGRPQILQTVRQFGYRLANDQAGGSG